MKSERDVACAGFSRGASMVLTHLTVGIRRVKRIYLQAMVSVTFSWCQSRVEEKRKRLLKVSMWDILKNNA